MNDLKKAHCRLCAKLKPFSKLVNLQTDDEMRRKIVDKLLRLSLEVIHPNTTNDLITLPKTVCFPCIESLDAAFNFIINVETSQSVLNTFITQHKLKEEIIDNDNIYDPFNEFDTSSEPEVTKTPVINSDNTRNKGKDSVADGIALSQLKLSWKDYSWLCAYCDTRFPSIDELKQHSMEYHGCCNPYRCIDCNVRKLNLDKFLKHVRRHRQHLKLSCYKCHSTFSRQYDVIRHKKEHITTPFKCPGCNETFATMKLSMDHCSTYNKDKKVRDVPKEHITADFTCVFCPKKFKHKGGLTRHLLIHTDRKRDHTCEKCGKCFLNKFNLAGHMMLHDGIKPHQCKICKRQFRTLPQLRTHIGVHDGKKPFSCEQCGRHFRLKKQLSSHSIIHTDSLPYGCSYCQKKFRFKSILDQHVRQHTGLRPYECQVCHRDFTNWSNYNKHMKRRHDMNMAKRKHTPEGLLVISPTAGEINIEPETNMTLEWKTKILNNSNRPGRPKCDTNGKKMETILSKIKN